MKEKKKNKSFDEVLDLRCRRDACAMFVKKSDRSNELLRSKTPKYSNVCVRGKKRDRFRTYVVPSSQSILFCVRLRSSLSKSRVRDQDC